MQNSVPMVNLFQILAGISQSCPEFRILVALQRIKRPLTGLQRSRILGWMHLNFLTIFVDRANAKRDAAIRDRGIAETIETIVPRPVPMARFGIVPATSVFWRH